MLATFPIFTNRGTPVNYVPITSILLMGYLAEAEEETCVLIFQNHSIACVGDPKSM